MQTGRKLRYPCARWGLARPEGNQLLGSIWGGNTPLFFREYSTMQSTMYKKTLEIVVANAHVRTAIV